MKIDFDGRKLAGGLVAAPVLAVLGFSLYKKRYLAKAEDAPGTLPGDEMLCNEVGASSTTHSIVIDAPPEKIWPLVNQIGQTKAGFYSFSLFENLTQWRIFNTYTPQDRWQHTKVGDWCFFGHQGIGMGWEIHEPQEYLVGLSDTRKPPTEEGAIAWLPHGTNEFAFSWGFYLEELPDGKTRLISRTWGWAELKEEKTEQLKALAVAGLMWGWSSGVMTTRLLAVIKACAEDKWFLPT